MIDNIILQQNEQDEEGNEVFTHRGQKSSDVSRFMLFLRIMSLLHTGLGVYAWLYIIGVIYPETSYFDDNLLAQILILFVATTSFVASIGLWFLAQWGITMWLMIGLVIAAFSVMQDNILFDMISVLLIQFSLMIVYIWLKRRYEHFILEYGYQHL